MTSSRTVMLLGDSLLAKFGKWQIAALESRTDGWHVLNCAAGGFNVFDVVARSERLGRVQPEAIILSSGLNDLAHWKERVTLEDYERTLGTIFELFAASRIIMLIPPRTIEARQPAEELRPTAVVDQYRSVAHDVCARHGVHAVDGERVATSVRASGQESHVDDGVHLAPCMYDALIVEFADALTASTMSPAR